VRRRRCPRFMGGLQPFRAISTHVTLRDSAC
jgi:hypothetical protein